MRLSGRLAITFMLVLAGLCPSFAQDGDAGKSPFQLGFERFAQDAQQRFDVLCGEAGIPQAVLYYRGASGLMVMGMQHGEIDKQPQSVWPVGSITKTYTAVLALELQEAGLIELDEPVSSYVPEIDDIFTQARLADTSLRTLMHHRSGLPYQLGDPEDYAPLVPVVRLMLGPQPRLGHEALLATVANRPLEFEPGQGYQYSNANFWLAALAMERATGRDYDELLQEYVLDPLGLENTSLWEVPAGCQAVAAHITVNGQLLDITGWDMPGMGRAAGGIRCTGSDLLKFSDAISGPWRMKQEGIECATALHGLDIRQDWSIHYKRSGEGFLTAGQLEQLYEFIDTGSTAHSEPYSYGLGISRRFDGEHWMYGHNGTTPGNRSLWRFDPESGETMILFSSLGNQGLNRIADEMLAMLREVE